MSRKFRHVVEGIFPSGNFGPLFFKAPQQRPDPSAEEKTYITTIIASASDRDIDPLYHVLAAFYEKIWKDRQLTPEELKDVIGTLVVTLYDGCGTPMERWTFKGVWPNWGDLDYSSSDECTTEITWVYSEFTYENLSVRIEILLPTDDGCKPIIPISTQQRLRSSSTTFEALRASITPTRQSSSKQS